MLKEIFQFPMQKWQTQNHCYFYDSCYVNIFLLYLYLNSKLLLLTSFNLLVQRTKLIIPGTIVLLAWHWKRKRVRKLIKACVAIYELIII